MPKSHAIEDALAALQGLRADATSPAAQKELRLALSHKAALVVAKAAQIVGDAELGTLTHELVAAFERFLIHPVKTDPNCVAKTAIADTLYRLGADAGDVFLRGIRHVQMEPVWGGRNDTAGSLRGVCALGLVRIGHRDALLEISDLLADLDPRVRANAARALAYSENPQAILLLRLRALVGDDPEVVGECFAALVAIDPLSSLPFIERFLARDDPLVQESAALALGASRLPDAFTLLRTWWEQIVQVDLRKTALLAVAMIKHDDAIDFLLQIIREGKAMDGRDAIAALAIYKHDDALVERIRKAVAQRQEVDLSAPFERMFEKPET
ncbi:MAG TPA: HEAT repeat domain-containing protein [Candidatus Acidoferrales bacterium]|nr:HEAT repeat domain-containing protein [Candidatus Acidoferrales bacterium]